ncbi:hypothetical protein RE428_17940 [Marinobacter nanhaiticus D15-8W]|uniref:Lipopolysaccharide biosynthesis protein n=1 Tax=Marinobacter nanhaiticus D15-8W TaxID=626887 RepID=N6VZT0_9GAMM|nr:Wzz/FepE/Etk N-terminal domain-containing protein [Marinobacter nanhaiticus]ENO13409.1 lipopolysaccharide biosynthesis protein [Marinobacter nanhaiticus D15-8W]BES70776.1 hypothetical protein RE428_17940 [Marinobacter nanhaiticus D15-8W]
MNSAYEQQQKLDDDISLVDLAAVFVRRRFVFYIVFIIVTLAGLAYALLASDKYEYVSLLEVAKLGDGKSVEQPHTVIATIENRWLPEVGVRFRAEMDMKLPFEVKASNPEQTSLVRLVSEAEQESADLVEKIHTTLIEKVKEHQNGSLKIEEKSLQRQVKSLDDVIQALEGQQNAGEALASAIEKRVNLESELEQLKPVDELVVSRQSADKTEPRRVLIVVVAGILAGAGGIFAVFLAEFCVLVRAKLRVDIK